nr:SDR family oxidoreductase [Alteribacillus sp. YIM 98480]
MSAEEWDQVINKICDSFHAGPGERNDDKHVKRARFKGKKRTGPYNAAKGGLVTLTKNAALEYGRYGIRVNANAPGVMDTPIVDAWRKDEKKDYFICECDWKNWGARGGGGRSCLIFSL